MESNKVDNKNIKTEDNKINISFKYSRLSSKRINIIIYCFKL
jgi:hypothetical protein